jgi:hypothetical protein
MSNPAWVGMSGPLSVFAAGFLEELVRRGYRPGTAAKQRKGGQNPAPSS